MTIKQNSVFSFLDGTLTVKVSGHGAQDGWGQFVWDEKQIEHVPHEEDSGHSIAVDIPKSELIELRDFLNLAVRRPRGEAPAERDLCLAVVRETRDNAPDTDYTLPEHKALWNSVCDRIEKRLLAIPATAASEFIRRAAKLFRSIERELRKNPAAVPQWVAEDVQEILSQQKGREP